jgi:predicted phosphodiesterase
VRGSGIQVVMGNCEEALGAGAADCGCGFAEGSACGRLAAFWYAHADRTLTAESRRWMAALPRRLDVEIGGRRLAVIHGGSRQINRFLFASSAPGFKLEEILATGCDGIIAGHCGLPFSQVIGERLWHNAGAVGLPANDGTPRVWYSVLTPEAEGLRIEHRALAYDCEVTAAKMRAAGLPEGYAKGLESGCWPSCDVLPPAERARQGVPLAEGELMWHRAPKGTAKPAYGEIVASWPPVSGQKPLDPRKFKDPEITAGGERRATVALEKLRTLWFNTGTLCNIACRNCYIESSPRNDRLIYLSLDEVRAFLDEIERARLGTEEIGFTGGEPFLNPDLLAMLEECLTRGFEVLLLTNAMRPMQRLQERLLDLNRRLGARLTVRVSLDHFTKALHEEERGPGTFEPTLRGLIWLARNGFNIAVAGRTAWGETEVEQRDGFAGLFAAHGIRINARDRRQLVLFPEMDARSDVPEITERCWGILHVDPRSVMCASSRMVVKRKGASRPAVVACTLLPYDEAFELGATLAETARPVALNHPHCARFCVLGGASCSAS